MCAFSHRESALYMQKACFLQGGTSRMISVDKEHLLWEGSRRGRVTERDLGAPALSLLLGYRGLRTVGRERACL